MTLSPSLQRWIGIAAAIAALAASAYALVQWWPILSMELHGALESDAHLYFTVGRGMLNGMQFWSELFESKPPGMFQLAALSLLLTGNEWPAIVMQILIYAAIPGMLAATAWIVARRQGHGTAIAAAVASMGVLFGLMIDFFLEERAGGFQTESVGSFFACAYLLLICLWPDRISYLRVAVLGLLVFAAVWMKEPFILALFAGSMLLCRSGKHWLWVFLIPCCIAGVIELLFLLALGSLGDYVRLYLPAMLYSRVGTDRLDPLYLRGLTIGRLYGNVTTYYTAPTFGYVLALLWILFPFFKNPKRERAAWELPAVIVMSVVAYYAIWFGFFRLVMFNASFFYGVQVVRELLPPEIWLIYVLVPAFVVLLSVTWKRGYGPAMLAAIGALYLSTLAVGISVYPPNHFAFAVPLFVALGLALMRYAATFPFTVPVGITLAALLWAGLAYQPSARQMELLRDRLLHTSATEKVVTEKLDGLLDACKIEHYGALDTFDRFSFAKHSPLGPMVVMHFFEYLGWEHPLVIETQRKLRDEAQIIVSGGGADHEHTIALIADRFTEDPPDCAKPFLPLDNLKTYFRKA